LFGPYYCYEVQIISMFIPNLISQLKFTLAYIIDGNPHRSLLVLVSAFLGLKVVF
jgi:hypothetical protein